MKKIVFIHLFNDRSGSPKVLSQVIIGLSRKGYKTELLTSDHKDGFLTNVADVNRFLFYRRSENKILTLFLYLSSQFILFFQCLRYWNKDVIFYINTMMPFGAALAAKLMRKKIIYHVHETSLKPKLLKFFLRKVISLTASNVIFVSKYLESTEFFLGKKQSVVYNAIDFTVITVENKIKSDFVALMVCSLKEYKGVYEFIKLSHNMKGLENLHFELILNATNKEISNFFNGVNIPNNLSVIDRQSDVSKYYSEASLLLNLSLPDSWVETFGLTILEGMKYGLPCIVPPIGGPVEIVRDGVEGYHISSYDLDSIAKKIEFLLGNHLEYKKLSRNAKNRVADFDISMFEKKIISVIEDIAR